MLEAAILLKHLDRTMRLDPKNFGLPARTLLEKVDENTIAIIIHRKSRIIMKDGHKILEKSHKIQKVQATVNVAIKTNAPICSKTKAYLEDNGIKSIMLEKSA